MLYKKKTIAPSYKANSCCSSWGHFMKSETSAVHKWWQMLVPVNSSLNMVVWACCRAAHWLIGLSHSMSPPWCPPFENKRTSFLHSGGALEHWRGSAETTADADFQLLSVNKHPVWCRALYWAFLTSWSLVSVYSKPLSPHCYFHADFPACVQNPVDDWHLVRMRCVERRQLCSGRTQIE